MPNLSTVEIRLLTGGYIPIKPQGVRIDYYIIGDKDIPLFMWDVESEIADGWDKSAWGAEYEPT